MNPKLSLGLCLEIMVYTICLLSYNHLPLYTFLPCSIAPYVCSLFVHCCVLLWSRTNRYYRCPSGLHPQHWAFITHNNDVTMSMMAAEITSLTSVYSTLYSGADQRKHQSSALLAFVRGNHRWPVNSPHKGPVTRKMFPFDDVITSNFSTNNYYDN